MATVATPAPVRIRDQRELKRLIQQMNRALRDSEGGGLMERFEAVSKILFTKIVDEREIHGRWGDGPAKDRLDLEPVAGESDLTLYERARATWQRAIATYTDVFAGRRADFPRDVGGVARILRLLAGYSLSNTANDVKGGAYEEMLRNTFEKNENQQYFTPRHIVDFVVGLCDPDGTEAACDPASGSGGFLVGALAAAARKGADVGEFGARMRGTEVDERMAWVARINMLMHGGDPRSIFHVSGAGSLAPLSRLRRSLPRASFDLILTNPPFGSDMTDPQALATFETGRGRANRRRGVLFVERCIALLRPGGRLAIVLDDSVLNLAGNTDVQRLIRRDCVVEAVVSLPDVAFMPYSTAKSSVLVLRKRQPEDHHQPPVFMADVENVGNRPNGDPLYSDEVDADGHRKLKSDLPGVAELFAAFRAGDQPLEAFEGTTVFTADIGAHLHEPDGERLDVFFYHPAREAAHAQLAASRHPLVELSVIASMDSRSVSPAAEFGDSMVRWIGLADIEAATGRYDVKEVLGDRIRSMAHQFEAGDFLFSRLRPKLRKSLLVPEAEEGGVCSSELMVLRIRPDFEGRVVPEYLDYMLRSDLAYGQLIYRITGVGRPRVSAETVRRLRLPLPPLEVQRRLVRQMRAADARALVKRSAAMRQLEEAGREMGAAYKRLIAELCPPTQGHLTHPEWASPPLPAAQPAPSPQRASG